MIQKARLDLDKNKGETLDDTIPQEKQHSFFSGFALIFLGTMASSVALQYSPILALALGTPFILLGMRRVMRTSKKQYKKRVVSESNN